MPTAGRVHDRELLDALEAIDPMPLSTTVWRTTRKGRDPTRGSTAAGRWNAADELEVLYTSLTRKGSLAEVGYRLGLEPIWPSKLEHEIHEISVEAERLCDLSDFALLTTLGVDESKYESHFYLAEQAISAAAHFLGFDGILVPSARNNCDNLVLYTDVIDCGILSINQKESVDWNNWRAANKARPSRLR